jgi:hypothetical protein
VTGRAAAVQGGLAALGLLTAYLTWQRDPDRMPGDVKVIDASKSDAPRIRYEDDNNAVEMWREGRDSTVWVRLTEKPKTPPAADKAKEKKPPPPRVLLGGEGAVSLYEKFTPFISPRSFGVLEAGKLKELGLDPAKKKLTVTVKGDTREFVIGQPPGGSTAGESFLRDTRDGRVYLMPRAVTPELQNAAHVIDRKLHTFDTPDFDRIALTVNGKRKEYVHLAKESLATEGFASAKTPDKRDQMAKNWHDSVWRLFPTEVLGKGETPAEGTPKVLMRVDYLEHKDSPGWLEIAKIEAADKTSSDEPPSPTPPGEMYARSEHTVGWIKIHSGQQIVADAEKLVAQP